MSRIDTILKNTIIEYYDNLINDLRKDIKEEEHQNRKLIIEEFNKTLQYNKIKELVEDLRIMFNSYQIDFKCKIYNYQDFKSNKCKDLINKIDKLNKEKTKLLITLSTNSMTSKTYKEELSKFMKKLEEKQ